MKDIKNLVLGISLFIIILITGNSITGNVVQVENSIRHTFTCVNILFFFLIMAFVIWLVNYVKNDRKHKNK